MYDLLLNAKQPETVQNWKNSGQRQSKEEAWQELAVQFYVTIDAVATLTTLTVPLARRKATTHPNTTHMITPMTNVTTTSVTPLTLHQERQESMVQVASTYCASLGINEASCTASIYAILATQMDTYTSVVEQRQQCVKHSVLVVAHPDDEALFAGQELIRDPACWVVVCATNR